MLEKLHSFFLLNLARITYSLDNLQERDNSHVVLSGEDYVLLLHGGLLDHLFKFLSDFNTVLEGLVNIRIVSLDVNIGKQLAHYSDGGQTRIFQRLIDIILLVYVVCFLSVITNMRQLRNSWAAVVPAAAQRHHQVFSPARFDINGNISGLLCQYATGSRRQRGQVSFQP